jgi:hypothetical protein
MSLPCSKFPDRLCEGFASLSRWTYRTLRFANQQPFSIREETITESLLMLLLQKYPHRIKIHKFTQKDESVTGADWDWLFVGRSQVFRMRIQAKKLYLSGKYESLNYPTDKNKPRQVSNLIASAKQATPPRFPAYCFYNHWTGKPDLGGKYCGLKAPSGVVKGCTIAAASRVQLLVNQSVDDLASVAKISIPLNSLACCDSIHCQSKPVGNNWLPEAVRHRCVDLVDKEDEVPQYEPVDSDKLDGYLSDSNRSEIDTNLAGIVAFFQEDRLGRLRSG